MPRNQFQRMIFALLTVIVTVHSYVFYSLYVVNGDILMQVTGQSSVLAAIEAQGGIYMFGKMLPIWAVVIIEFCLAFLLENIMGSPCSFKLASKLFDPRKDHPVIFESAVICATVGLMCPAMSFIAAWAYYPYYAGFNIFTLLANFLELVCYNLPFAFFLSAFLHTASYQKSFQNPFQKRYCKTSGIKRICKHINITNRLLKSDGSILNNF